MQPIIDIQNVSKIYQMGDDPKNKFKALDNVSLRIERGEYLAIVGPSGSGKSTLLQILGLLDPPSTGQYDLMGKDTIAMSDNQRTYLRSHHIGFVFQMFNLLRRTSAIENVVLPMIYKNGKADEDHAKKILSDLGLQNHMHHTPSQLSGGQQQRVAIARALVNNPDIIFADEPTGNLPQKQSHEIITALENQNRQNNITLVMITHSPDLASRADRVVSIIDGKIVEDKQNHSRKVKVNAPAIEAEKSITPKMNLRLWLQTTKMAFSSMLQNKVRTFLTMLGIIIGVFSVVSMLAIGEGAKKNVEYELRRLGSNLFRIKSQWPKIKGSSSQKRTITYIDEKDLATLQRLIKDSPLIKNVAASREDTLTITYNGYSYSTKVIGVSPSYEVMRGNTPAYGRFFTEEENANQERVCVLGQTAYKNLYKKQKNPIGTIIKINDRNFRVIGLLPSKGASWSGDVDDVVYIPEQTGLKRVFGARSYHYFFVQATNQNTLKDAVKLVTQTLRQRHEIEKEMQNDFAIKNYGEMKQTVDQVSSTMIKLIVLVALISLIVGGIGIMNIMLVSVTERTREIGVRKAIGARSSDILKQFLIESVCIGLVGGLVGVIFAYITGYIIEHTTGWEIIFKPYGIVVAFIFSVLVGVFFGLYPAKKAAGLPPIHALRYE
jgi:macrolide transport system ATP-binding/permease protein